MRCFRLSQRWRAATDIRRYKTDRRSVFCFNAVKSCKALGDWVGPAPPDAAQACTPHAARRTPHAARRTQACTPHAARRTAHDSPKSHIWKAACMGCRHIHSFFSFSFFFAALLDGYKNKMKLRIVTHHPICGIDHLRAAKPPLYIPPSLIP